MEKRLSYYILSVVCLLAGCNPQETEEPVGGHTVAIYLRATDGFHTRVVDADNLASEQTINNISLFFAEPSTTTFTHTFIHTGFTISGDYQLITLPLEPTELLTKDIYVIANYDDTGTLETLTSTTQLLDMHTPEVDKTNNLDPSKGFCMYGFLLDADFTDTSQSPLTVGLTRACAKYRINLTFPDDPNLSTVNSFLIQQAAKYTYIIDNNTHVLPLTDYFNFAAPLPLTNNGADVYTNMVYLYDATAAPAITIYVYLGGSAITQEFTGDLPIPQRNYLYDINIEGYEESSTTLSLPVDTGSSYTIQSRIKVYNEQGELTAETDSISLRPKIQYIPPPQNIIKIQRKNIIPLAGRDF